MIQATLAIPFDAVDAIDTYLLEAGDGRWMVSQDVLVHTAHLIGVFESESDAQASWAALAMGDGPLAGLAQPSLHTLADQDWRDSYKAHFKASRFGRLHWVPIWERESYVVPAGDAVIWLDPGLAFGTGNHETTRLCCERLVALADRLPSTARVIDAGCGSGILALSARRLGFEHVDGFDNDPEAVRVSEENAALNGLDGKVSFFVGDLTSGLAGRKAAVVLANIQADVLMRFADELLAAVEPHGALVLSGILARELEQVRTTFAARVPGWTFETRTLGEWSDVFAVRP